MTALALAHTVAAEESEMRSSSDETVGEALISICDRHIFLDGHHASQGLNPPVNILCGAPRGDGRGQLPAIAKLVIGLREQLVAGTAADENAKLAVSLGLDPEEEMQRHLFNNGRLQAVFNRQQQGTHVSLRELWLSLALSTGEFPDLSLPVKRYWRHRQIGPPSKRAPLLRAAQAEVVHRFTSTCLPANQRVFKKSAMRSPRHLWPTCAKTSLSCGTALVTCLRCRRTLALFLVAIKTCFSKVKCCKNRYIVLLNSFIVCGKFKRLESNRWHGSIIA